MMNKTPLKVVFYYHSNFLRNAKRLKKKYPSFENDLKELLALLEENPEAGVLIQPNVRKIRLAIASKKQGKSGGARVVTYFDARIMIEAPTDSETIATVFLLTIYIR